MPEQIHQPLPKYTNPELHRELMSLLLPEYKSREEVLTHVRRTLNHEMAKARVSLDDVTQFIYIESEDNLKKDSIKEGLRAKLEGKAPMDFKTYLDLHLPMALSFDDCFPYRPNITESEYKDMHKRLFGRLPEQVPDPDGRLSVKLYLQEKFFED